MKSFENTFETPKVCLSCSIWLENHFPRLEPKKIWNFFWIFFDFFLKKTSKTSHSAEKWKGGTLWDSLTYFLLQNIKNLLRHQKFSKKKFAQCRKKIERGDPLESSGFVGYVKKVKNERGTLCSKFALVELGLSELISFCKKWYIRDELCGLTKKKKKLATVIVGLFSLKEKAPTNNSFIIIEFVCWFFHFIVWLESLVAPKTVALHPKSLQNVFARYKWALLDGGNTKGSR